MRSGGNTEIEPDLICFVVVGVDGGVDAFKIHAVDAKAKFERPFARFGFEVVAK